jgi:hypothetical protein
MSALAMAAGHALRSLVAAGGRAGCICGSNFFLSVFADLGRMIVRRRMEVMAPSWDGREQTARRQGIGTTDAH